MPMPMPRIGYYHFLLDRHEVVFAEGAGAESLLPGPMAWRALPGEDRVFVKGISGGCDAEHEPARLLLRPGQWRRLLLTREVRMAASE